MMRIKDILLRKLKSFLKIKIYLYYRSINHYDVVEKFYRNWERENRNAKEIKYPEMEITPPKDDIVEYTSENVDAW